MNLKNLVLGATKTCPITHLTMKEMSFREGVVMLVTKSHCYGLFTTSHCAKEAQNYEKWKKCSFSFQNSMSFVYFFAIVWSLYFFVNCYTPWPEISW